MLDRELLRDNLRIAPEQPATALWRAIELGHLLRSKALPAAGRGLDLGCGNGLVTGLVRERSGARWEELVGVDPDPREVALARESGIYDAVHESPGDAIEVADGAFDFVFSNSVLEHVDELEPTVREVGRVLRPGGLFVFTVPSPSFPENLGRPGPVGRLATGARDVASYRAAIDRRLAHRRYLTLDEWRATTRERGPRAQGVVGLPVASRDAAVGIGLESHRGSARSDHRGKAIPDRDPTRAWAAAQLAAVLAARGRPDDRSARRAGPARGRSVAGARVGRAGRGAEGGWMSVHVCLVYDLLYPVHDRRRRPLVPEPRRASRRGRASRHLPDAAPLARRRGRRRCRESRSSPSAPGSSSTPRAGGGGSGRHCASAWACSATSTAQGARYDVVHTGCVPVLLAARGRPGPATTCAFGSSSTGSRSGRASTGATISARSVGASGLRCSAAASASRSRLSASRGCSPERLQEQGLRGDLTVLEGIYAGPPGSPPEPAEPVVVFAGRHIPEKQAAALVPAIARARARVPELRGEIIGDGPARPEVLRLIAEHGLDGAVEAPGFVAEERLNSILRRALCLALPSKREGYGLVVVEAAAHGVPSVVVRGPDNAADRARRGRRERSSGRLRRARRACGGDPPRTRCRLRAA